MLFPLSWKMALKQYLKQYFDCWDLCQLESGIGNLSTCIRTHALLQSVVQLGVHCPSSVSKHSRRCLPDEEASFVCFCSF